MALLTIGDQFPAYELTALIGGDLSKIDAQQPGDILIVPVGVALAVPVALAITLAFSVAVALSVALADDGDPGGRAEQAGPDGNQGADGQRDV